MDGIAKVRVAVWPIWQTCLCAHPAAVLPVQPASRWVAASDMSWRVSLNGRFDVGKMSAAVGPQADRPTAVWGVIRILPLGQSQV